jgi:probable DNA repair protein
MLRWQKLIFEFANLDRIVGSITRDYALNLLNLMVNFVSFQPKTQTVSLQILGALEAANQQFDYIWLFGLNNVIWPPQPNPNPFLPVILQRQLKMPNASAELQYAFYRKLTESFIANGKFVTASYSMQKEDRILQSSSIIKNLQKISLMDLQLPVYRSKAQEIFATKVVEFSTDQLVPLLENEIPKGGSGIFKYQAACPFSAFAKFRLHAEALEQPQLGLSSKDRGLLLHDIMARVWSHIQDHNQLCQYNDTELQQFVATIIADGLLQFRVKKPYTLTEKFLFIEQTRLNKLIFNWLLLEKKRQPFRVLAKEVTQEISIANMSIQLRIDRIDALPDGTHVIIDYKSGNNSYRDWLSDRPDEPQLPLYCVTSKIPISGLSFAQIQAKQIRFNGITIEPDCLPNIPALSEMNSDALLPKTWLDLMQQWQAVLKTLSIDFYNGQAKVDPKNSDKTCKYCDLKPLCRIYEKDYAANI